MFSSSDFGGWKSMGKRRFLCLRNCFSWTVLRLSLHKYLLSTFDKESITSLSNAIRLNNTSNWFMILIDNQLTANRYAYRLNYERIHNPLTHRSTRSQRNTFHYWRPISWNTFHTSKFKRHRKTTKLLRLSSTTWSSSIKNQISSACYFLQTKTLLRTQRYSARFQWKDDQTLPPLSTSNSSFRSYISPHVIFPKLIHEITKQQKHVSHSDNPAVNIVFPETRGANLSKASIASRFPETRFRSSQRIVRPCRYNFTDRSRLRVSGFLRAHGVTDCETHYVECLGRAAIRNNHGSF